MAGACENSNNQPNINMKKLLAVAVLTASTLAGASAQILTQWSFSGLSGGLNDFGPSPFAATTSALNATYSGLVRGSGIGTTGTGAGGAWGGNDFTGTSLETAITLNEYVSFTITPDAGFALSFAGIDAYNIRRSASGPTTGIWQYQVGGGEFVSIGSPITWGSTTSATGNPQSSIDLSGIAGLQGVTDAVTFRVVVWGASGTGGTWYFNGSAASGSLPLTINGAVTPVPEPHEYAVAMAGLLLTVVVMRRRAQRA
jgi:hypothetical protein